MTDTTKPIRQHKQLGPPTASPLDTLRLAAMVAAPTLAGGVIKRRPRALGLAEKLRADASAIRLLQKLRARYGTEPLRLALPGRSLALVMSAADVGTVLAGAPEPFTPASLEKRGALRHFQPHGVLISEGAARAERRAFNERVLETSRPVHSLAGPVVATVHEEASRLLADAERDGKLDWDRFNAAWWRLARRVTLGDGARDDQLTSELLDRLRLDANWAGFHPRRRDTRTRLLERLRAHLARAEDGSLAGLIGANQDDDPESQVAHWLFAFDAAGMTTFRTLGLLAAHPAQRAKATGEIAETDHTSPAELPYLRACVREALRLWPTTPAILRDVTTDVGWHNGTLPKGTGLLIFAPFFHRDDENLPYAHSFTPEIWLDGRADRNPALVPFSAGPGVCPGRNLVLLVTSTLLAALLERHDYQVTSRPSLAPVQPLPATLDNFSLRFAVRPR